MEAALRNETRFDRYASKLPFAKRLPISIATVNFRDELNIGLVVRAAACFGASSVHVVGTLPKYNELKRTSAGTCDFIDLKCHSHPQEFVEWIRTTSMKMYAAELVPEAKSIFGVSFDFASHSMVVVGHETEGIPVEILKNSIIVQVPMVGPGFCLNTSQAANVFLFEFVRQFSLSSGGKNA